VAERTVRELVGLIQAELASVCDLTPDRASEMLNQATALLGNCLDEQRTADQAYKVILLHCLRNAEKANRAKIEAECSPQWAKFTESRDTLKLVEQMIISLRQFLRTQAETMRLGSGH
jgi:hypothetical protein